MAKIQREEDGVVVTEQFNETAPGDPARVPQNPARAEEGAYDPPMPKETNPLGTTDGEEPRVVAKDLLKEIQRPIKPSALPENHDDALVGDEDEDMEADHNSRTVTQDPRGDAPEAPDGTKVVQVDEEVVVSEDDATHLAGPSEEEKNALRAALRPETEDFKVLDPRGLYTAEERQAANQARQEAREAEKQQAATEREQEKVARETARREAEAEREAEKAARAEERAARKAAEKAAEEAAEGSES